MSFGSTNKNGVGAGGSPYWLLVDDAGHLMVGSAWEPTLQADEALNDSDKSITVAADEEWIVKWIWVELTTTAVAGNRQMTIEIQDDAADVVATIKAGVTQAASLTYNYLFAPHLPDLTAVRDTTYLMTPMPEFKLPTGYIIRIYDSAAVDAAADDMICQVMADVRATT